MPPNGWVERRARRGLGLALYLARVRSNEVLDDPYLRMDDKLLVLTICANETQLGAARKRD
jgi:hypothetical protein